MTITLKRKIMSEIMTTYFPSLLLMMITFATTFFKPFFFEAALSVNLTTMLVMTTIFISKMEGLPHTSDIKMIDIWLIFCQLVPFSEVVLLTAIEHLRDNDDLMMMGNKNGNITLKSPFMKQCRNTYILALKAIGMYLKSFMKASCEIFYFQRREHCLWLQLWLFLHTLVLLYISTITDILNIHIFWYYLLIFLIFIFSDTLVLLYISTMTHILDILIFWYSCLALYLYYNLYS